MRSKALPAVDEETDRTVTVQSDRSDNGAAPTGDAGTPWGGVCAWACGDQEALQEEVILLEELSRGGSKAHILQAEKKKCAKLLSKEGKDGWRFRGVAAMSLASEVCCHIP